MINISETKSAIVTVSNNKKGPKVVDLTDLNYEFAFSASMAREDAEELKAKILRDVVDNEDVEDVVYSTRYISADCSQVEFTGLEFTKRLDEDLEKYRRWFIKNMLDIKSILGFTDKDISELLKFYAEFPSTPKSDNESRKNQFVEGLIKKIFGIMLKYQDFTSKDTVCREVVITTNEYTEEDAKAQRA